MRIGNNGQSFGQDLWFGYCYLGSLFLTCSPSCHPLFVKRHHWVPNGSNQKTRSLVFFRHTANACVPPPPPPDLHSPNTFTGLLLLFVPIIIYSHTAVETTFYSSLLGHLLTCPVTSQPLCVVQLKHCDLAPGFWNDQVL